MTWLEGEVNLRDTGDPLDGKEKSAKMTIRSPLIVRVERPETSLGDTMNEIRSWLDSHKMQPTDFRSDSSVPGAAAFEIKFNREDEARMFEQAFA